MREVFKPVPEDALRDPGRVFYTITPGDVGKRTIVTTIGPIELSGVIGYVQRGDVGKRLYRVPCDDPAAGWIWQCESGAQQSTRLAVKDIERVDAASCRDPACTIVYPHYKHNRGERP